ncbi:regulatory particle non-ATPase 12B [Actinidia rufa]|uniref:Regulatory particle non-ATPase 12B n=1 Tax=Actinidia rufa TaxID=165716 RepID=A0A7J0DM24_9ERIC|nr:regulatory particle non-ATPase 12B [Actinidia rufa]
MREIANLISRALMFSSKRTVRAQRWTLSLKKTLHRVPFSCIGEGFEWMGVEYLRVAADRRAVGRFAKGLGRVGEGQRWWGGACVEVTLRTTCMLLFSVRLPPSPQEYPILGLNLLRLLVQNRIAEFHTELELLSASSLENPCIKHAVELEQSFMEGAYNCVLSARQTVLHETYVYFMDLLAKTVRYFEITLWQ